MSSSRPITHCQFCDGDNLRLILDLGMAPPPCVVRPFGFADAEGFYPVQLLACRDCSLVQMGHRIDPNIVFPEDYGYSSGNSGALVENFKDLASNALLSEGDLAVDIGANDGTLLAQLPANVRRVGVEPTRQGEKIEQLERADWVQGFFDRATMHAIDGRCGPAKLVTACNVMAHIPNPDEAVEAIHDLLDDDGVFIAENHNLASVVAGQWDTVYHEHLRFYEPYTFAQLLMRHGLAPTLVEHIPTHGGSFRMHAKKYDGPNPPLPPVVTRGREYDFAKMRGDAARARRLIRAHLSTARSGGHHIMGVGAAARATPIIHYCGITADDLDAVVEVAGSNKIGTYMPGTRIPVIDEEALFRQPMPQYAFLFSWHMADRIMPALRNRHYGGEFMVPLPEWKYVRRHKADPNRGYR